MPGPMGWTAATRDAIRFGDGASSRVHDRRRLDGRRIDLEERHALGLARSERAVVLGLPAIPAERLDHELHPIPLLVLVVAELLEDAQHRLGDAQDARSRHEVVNDRPPTCT